MNAEWIQKYCLSLPYVTEDVKWGDNLCFLIAKKLFCITDLEGEFSCSFKVKDEEFHELTEKDGIIQAPYFARNKWVSVRNPQNLSKKEWEHYLKQSYELVKAKLSEKILSQLG